MSDNPYEPSNLEQEASTKGNFGCYQFIVFGVVVFAVLMVFGLVWQGTAPAPITRPFPPPNGAAK